MRIAGRGLAFVALLLLSTAPQSLAQTVHRLEIPTPVERVIATASGALVQTGANFQSIVACKSASGLCLMPAEPPAARPAPAQGLPDGEVATASSGDIRSAWFARPTGRYAHGALGDAVEAGSLVAALADGRTVELVLPESQVFEDITPRIADLDGDGGNEIIAIRASRSGGAAVALYRVVEGSLGEVGAGSENGRRNRWLNIAGLVPRPDGGLTIYGVRTPHIGGRLFALDYGGGAVSERNDIALDLSNHVLGSRELGLSATGDFGGRFELVLPSQDRRRLRFPLSGRADIALPGQIDKAIALVDGAIVTATSRGDLLVIRP